MTIKLLLAHSIDIFSKKYLKKTPIASIEVLAFIQSLSEKNAKYLYQYLQHYTATNQKKFPHLLIYFFENQWVNRRFDTDFIHLAYAIDKFPCENTKQTLLAYQIYRVLKKYIIDPKMLQPTNIYPKIKDFIQGLSKPDTVLLWKNLRTYRNTKRLPWVLLPIAMVAYSDKISHRAFHWALDTIELDEMGYFLADTAIAPCIVSTFGEYIQQYIPNSANTKSSNIIQLSNVNELLIEIMVYTLIYYPRSYHALLIRWIIADTDFLPSLQSPHKAILTWQIEYLVDKYRKESSNKEAGSERIEINNDTVEEFVKRISENYSSLLSQYLTKKFNTQGLPWILTPFSDRFLKNFNSCIKQKVRGILPNQYTSDMALYKASKKIDHLKINQALQRALTRSLQPPLREEQYQYFYRFIMKCADKHPQLVNDQFVYFVIEHIEPIRKKNIIKKANRDTYLRTVFVLLQKLQQILSSASLLDNWFDFEKNSQFFQNIDFYDIQEFIQHLDEYINNSKIPLYTVYFLIANYCSGSNETEIFETSQMSHFIQELMYHDKKNNALLAQDFAKTPPIEVLLYQVLLSTHLDSILSSLVLRINTIQNINHFLSMPPNYTIHEYFYSCYGTNAYNNLLAKIALILIETSLLNKKSFKNIQVFFNHLKDASETDMLYRITENAIAGYYANYRLPMLLIPCCSETIAWTSEELGDNFYRYSTIVDAKRKIKQYTELLEEHIAYIKTLFDEDNWLVKLRTEERNFFFLVMGVFYERYSPAAYNLFLFWFYKNLSIIDKLVVEALYNIFYLEYSGYVDILAFLSISDHLLMYYYLRNCDLVPPISSLIIQSSKDFIQKLNTYLINYDNSSHIPCLLTVLTHSEVWIPPEATTLDTILAKLFFITSWAIHMDKEDMTQSFINLIENKDGSVIFQPLILFIVMLYHQPLDALISKHPALAYVQKYNEVFWGNKHSALSYAQDLAKEYQEIFHGEMGNIESLHTQLFNPSIYANYGVEDTEYVLLYWQIITIFKKFHLNCQPLYFLDMKQIFNNNVREVKKIIIYLSTCQNIPWILLPFAYPKQ